MTQAKATLYCSFCGKSQHEIRKLIAGPTVFICNECCNECVDLCKDIVDEENKLNDTKKWARENGYVLVKEDILINACVSFPGKDDIANSLSKFNAFFKRKN